jgi:hypothetical protein
LIGTGTGTGTAELGAPGNCHLWVPSVSNSDTSGARKDVLGLGK